MNIIKFPGGKQGRGDSGEVEHATSLKGRLVDFVTRGPMSGRHAEEMAAAGLEEPEFAEYVDFTDWFIFEWEDDDGTTVIDEFVSSQTDLTDADRRLLESWYDAIKDLFQVLAITEDGVEMLDGEGAHCFVIPTNMKATELGWRPKTLVETRILPVGDVFVLSGIQSFYSGPELDMLPDGVNLAAFANAMEADDEEDDDGIYDEEEDGPFEIDDVRELPKAKRPKGSPAAAAHDFLAELTKSPKPPKPETLEAHAMAVSFFAFYADAREVSRVDAVDVGLLLDFLAVWYPRYAPNRSLGATRQILASIGKFVAWLDGTYGTKLGRDYKDRVLPALKDDLPRTIKATDEVMRTFPFFGISQMIALMANEDDEIPTKQLRQGARGESYRARYGVVALDESTLTVRERESPGRAEGSETALLTTELPPKAAEMLRPGDVVEGIFFLAGSQLVTEMVDCIYCPAAGL